MADAALAVVAVLVLATAATGLRAVLDGRLVGTPASIAVLAPLAEAARLLRARSARSGAAPGVAGALLLAAAVLRVLVPTVAGSLGVGGYVVADGLWWVGGLLLSGRRGPFVLGALALEAPLVLALVAPAVSVRSIRVDDIVTDQQGLPLAAEMPVAFVIVLAIGGVLLPWAVQGDARRLGGTARLLVGAGLAAQPVSVAATASVLLLGLGGGWAIAASALLTAVLVVAARRFPALRMRRLTAPALAVLLPLALVQLAVVIVLAVLEG